MRDHDDADFRRYAAARAPALRRTAYLLCGDWHGAEDLVQVALTKLYLNWRRVRHQHSLDGYARKVLVRVYLDERRRKRPESPTATLPPTSCRRPGRTFRSRSRATAAR